MSLQVRRNVYNVRLIVIEHWRSSWLVRHPLKAPNSARNLPSRVCRYRRASCTHERIAALSIEPLVDMSAGAFSVRFLTFGFLIGEVETAFVESNETVWWSLASWSLPLCKPLWSDDSS